MPRYVLWGEYEHYCSMATELPNLPLFSLLFSMGQEWLLLLALSQVQGITSPCCSSLFRKSKALVTQPAAW